MSLVPYLFRNTAYNDDDDACPAITPTSRYCYKSWACDGDVIDDVTQQEQPQQQQHGPAVVSRDRCFHELGGRSWGLYGDNCEKRTDDPQQQPAHYVPDTLHGPRTI